MYSVSLKSVHARYLTLSDGKGVATAQSVRMSDMSKWEWSSVQVLDPEGMVLRLSQTSNKRSSSNNRSTPFLGPLGKRTNVVGALKDSAVPKPRKGEYWSVRLANVNRTYLRSIASGKYLRSRTQLTGESGVTTRAFTPSYIYDLWWVEMHPTDSHKAALRSHEGYFLTPQWGSNKALSSSQQFHFGVEAISPDPYYFNIVPFDYYNKDHERLEMRNLRKQKGLNWIEGEEIEHEIDCELTVVLYAEHDSKHPACFLSADTNGQVYLTSLPNGSSQSINTTQPSPEDPLQQVAWMIRWYRPIWPNILAQLNAELQAAIPTPVPVPAAAAPAPLSSSPSMTSSPDDSEPEYSPSVSVQLRAISLRMVDRARLHVNV
jgi:hypothetical protein